MFCQCRLEVQERTCEARKNFQNFITKLNTSSSECDTCSSTV